MLSSLSTKIALRKVGIKSNTFDFASPTPKASKTDGTQSGLNDDEPSGAWPKWMSTRKLPLTAQAWLSPIPPPIPIAECPKIGDLAPLDRDRQLTFGGGRKMIVLFMRCVGCAFAQKSFLALRALANRHQASGLKCIAVSHSSPEATRKWIDLLGGAWNVEVIIDEDRATYAIWGLGLGNVWYMFNPTTQREAWKEKGWLGDKVAGAITRTGSWGKQLNGNGPVGAPAPPSGVNGPEATQVEAENLGPSTVMGNKWQQAGLFAVDGRGTVVWAEKALRVDDCLDMNSAAKALGF
ncbi:hypothetical protein BKA67DRAFT_655206 [Truncatella angustata]|uniref:Alkyl hydroperoxide reductase subunit C/ Thiol specific antioxidant domain-containing protein n=1 Tax=Truncatella angustata TaxID=152316 RepID=A0A9P8URG8_9PEZI|nr:uncharacterized protein BKA67DRAFT_655206 [Truncatella angustata]KAH6656903.1 hypothetical protein BKA67DRAFT_655206 [Truncatella angustata]